MTSETDQLTIHKFGDRTICIGGIGKMFYQGGLPISMSIEQLRENNIEVSIFHVADECLKNGWSAKTTFNKLKQDCEEDIGNNNVDINSLESFCFAEYEDQREMIFQYLFGCSTNETRQGNKKPFEIMKGILA